MSIAGQPTGVEEARARIRVNYWLSIIEATLQLPTFTFLLNVITVYSRLCNISKFKNADRKVVKVIKIYILLVTFQSRCICLVQAFAGISPSSSGLLVSRLRSCDYKKKELINMTESST